MDQVGASGFGRHVVSVPQLQRPLLRGGSRRGGGTAQRRARYPRDHHSGHAAGQAAAGAVASANGGLHRAWVRPLLRASGRVSVPLVFTALGLRLHRVSTAWQLGSWRARGLTWRGNASDCVAAMETWDEFLPTVDSPTLSGVEAKDTIKFWVDLGSTMPGTLAGTALEDLRAASAWPASIRRKALIARCLAAANATADVRRGLAASLAASSRALVTPQHAQETLRDQLASVMVPESSASSMANALVAQPPEVGALQSAVKPQGLAHHMLPEAAVYHYIRSEVRTARTAERGDATLDMAAECQKAEEHILGQARTRLHGLLAEAGLLGRGSPSGPMAGSHEQAMADQLAQQRAATEAMMKRSAEASRDLMASADATRMRNDALAGGPSAPSGGKAKGKGKGQGGG